MWQKTIFFMRVVLIATLLWPLNAYAKTRMLDWVGSYHLKGGTGKMTIEKGEKGTLWIEYWTSVENGEEKGGAVFSASVHRKTAKKLPWRGELCPETLTLQPDGVRVIDDCSYPKKVYDFERVNK